MSCFCICKSQKDPHEDCVMRKNVPSWPRFTFFFFFCGASGYTIENVHLFLVELNAVGTYKTEHRRLRLDLESISSCRRCRHHKTFINFSLSVTFLPKCCIQEVPFVYFLERRQLTCNAERSRRKPTQGFLGIRQSWGAHYVHHGCEGNEKPIHDRVQLCLSSCCFCIFTVHLLSLVRLTELSGHSNVVGDVEILSRRILVSWFWNKTELGSTTKIMCKNDRRRIWFSIWCCIGVSSEQNIEELMKTDRPDWQSVMQYVSQIYKYFETWLASALHSPSRQTFHASCSVLDTWAHSISEQLLSTAKCSTAMRPRRTFLLLQAKSGEVEDVGWKKSPLWVNLKCTWTFAFQWTF